MAEVNKDVSVTIKGKDETGKAFQSATQNAKNFGGQVNTVSDSLKKLGQVAITYFAFDKISGFISSSTESAMAKAKVLSLVSAQIKKSGVDYTDASSKINEFSDSMEKLGIDGEVASGSVGKLLLKTKDVGRAMELSKVASDLASSGIGDYAGNTDLLQKILIGKGQRALLQFGISMSADATIAEQLDAVTKRVTRTTEEWSTTTEGAVARSSVQWQNFKEDIGAVGAVTLVNLSNAFTTAYNTIGGNTESLAKFLAEFLNIGLPASINNVKKAWFTVLGEITSKLTFIDEIKKKVNPNSKNQNLFGDITTGFGIQIEEIDKQNIELVNNFESSWNDLKGISKTGAVDVGNEYDYVGDEAEKLADKIKSSFLDMSKKLVSSFTEQTTAISKLRTELKDLENDTQKQLEGVDSKYKEDLKNKAKQSQERITQIDKEIEQTKNARSAGWRSQVAELEAEKAKEQAIIARVGGQVSNLNEELAKDDLTILKEKMEAEKATILEEANKTKAEKETEIGQRTGVQLRSVLASLSPALMDTLTAENNSFLGQIGAGPNQYIFTFNGDVNDQDKLIRVITEALNRQATLKGVAGAK